MNHYQRLGVTKATTLEEIEQAYKTRLQEYHSQTEQGLIIDKEAEIELEKSYQVIKKHLSEKQTKDSGSKNKAILLVTVVFVAIFLPWILQVTFPDYSFLWLWPMYFVLIVTSQTLSAVIHLLLFLTRAKADGVSRRNYLTQREKIERKRRLTVFLLIGLIIPVTAILWSFLHKETLVVLAGCFVSFFLAVGLALYDPITAIMAARRGKAVTTQMGRRFLIISIFIFTLIMGFLGTQYIPNDTKYTGVALVFALLFFLCCIISLILELWKMTKQ